MALLPVPGPAVTIAAGLTGVLVACIVWGTWSSPAAWWAPGDLSAAHTGRVSCGGCHTPFHGPATERCTSCHTGATFTRENRGGVGTFHLALVDAGRRCIDCHTEHRGGGAPITIGASGNPHGDVVFTLSGVSSCTACHAFAATVSSPPIILDTEPVRRVRQGGGPSHQPGRFIRCAGCHSSEG